MASESLRQPSGHILRDGAEVADTRQCVHCGRHWIWQRGSGRKRGFCMQCMGITCGGPRCDPCLPLERRLELYEKGMIPEL